MVPLLIVGGLGVLYFLTRTPSGIVPGNPASQFVGRFQAIGQPPSISMNNTDQKITAGFAAAAAHDPEPISKGVLMMGEKIAGFFTQAHTAAMKREGSTLNNATPTFISELQYVFQGLTQGAITESQAVEYLKQAQTDYESLTQGIRHDNGQCIPGCSYDGLSYGHTHCCNTGSSCNAACCIRCGLVVPAVTNLTKIIQAGGGSYTIAPFPNNGYIKGTPAVSFSYMRPGTGSQLVHSLFSRLGL